MIADPESQVGHPRLRQVLQNSGFSLRKQELKNVLGSGSNLAHTIVAGRQYLCEMARHGLSVPHWPTEFGGMDMTPEEMAAFAQEMSRFELPDLYPFLIGLNMVGPALCMYGSEEQQRLLPRIADGTDVWCQMFSERNAGSDLNSIETTAQQQGDGWHITGEKMWCGRAGVSDWGILLLNAKTETSDKPRKTLFCVPMNTLGVECHPIKQMNGDSNFYRVELDCHLSDSHRLGRVGSGWKIATTMLKMERSLSVDATGLGLDTENFMPILGSLIEPDDQVGRQMLAETYTTLWLLTTSQRFRPLPNLRTLGFTFFQQLSRFLCHIEGPEAMLESKTSSIITTAPSLGIRAGTIEIQKNTLAEKALRLPKL